MINPLELQRYAQLRQQQMSQNYAAQAARQDQFLGSGLTNSQQLGIQSQMLGSGLSIGLINSQQSQGQYFADPRTPEPVSANKILLLLED